MEALQSDQRVGYPPPSALPSTAMMAEPSQVIPTETEAPSVTTLVLNPTVVRIPEPTPTVVPTPIVVVEQASPTPEPPFILPTPQPLTNEQRWRAQQIQRIIFDPLRTYTTSSSELWWFDPIQQQHVILGTFSGDFLAQAQFILRGQGIEALEVPYQVNKSYGLTALSPAIVARIAAAGNGEWIETYVFVTPNVVPR